MSEWSLIIFLGCSMTFMDGFESNQACLVAGATARGMLRSLPEPQQERFSWGCVEYKEAAE